MADLARQTSEAFGDLEFEYDLKELLDKDPVAALGFDPDKAKFTAPQGYNNAHYLHKDKYTKDGKLLGKKDDIVYGPDFGASKDTIIHEFRHRGNRLLRQAYFKDPETFTKKYGQDVVDFLVGEFDEAKGKMYLGDRDEEFRTELGDNLEATFNRPRPDTAKLAANLLGEQSKRFSQEELEQMGTKFYLQNFDKFKGRMSDATELVTKEDQEKYKDILTKVRQAASDLIEERRGYDEGGLAESKGLSWGELIVDNILGLDNEYESFGEKLGKAINEDEIKFLKDAAVGVYEGTKEFVQAPVETTKQVVNEIKDSVTRLGSEDLNTRLQRMYNVTYEQATNEQVNQAREAVLGDALIALELVPAAKVTTTVAGAGVKAIAPNANTGAQTIKAFFNNKNDNLFDDDDGYDPVIHGDEDGYNPIIDDPDVVQEIKQMELDKKNYDFLDEISIQQAYDAGILNPEEWVEQTKTLFKKQMKNMNTGGVEYDQKNLFVKAAENIGADNLIDLVRNKPTDPKGKTKWSQKVSNYADQANLTYNQMLSALSSVQDSTRVYTTQLTERPLPVAKDTGEIYPKKPFEEEYPVRTPEQQALKEKAFNLGFKDTVYHTTRAQTDKSYPFGEEFTEFKLPDQLAGNSKFTIAAVHDLLGVHVGTARAAAERAEGYGGTGKFTMELKARLDKPAEVFDLSSLVGVEERMLQNDFIPSESDLAFIIDKEAENLFGKKNIYSDKEQLKAAKSLRQKLAEEGYTHIPYINNVEDKESISYIMLVDRPKDSPAVLRDTRAKFDPEQVNNPDLRFAEGGTVAMNKQMSFAFADGGLRDDGMREDPVSGNEVPAGSMAEEVRDDIPAQLSEGEYVVPADVVRYYGVKFFEDLRDAAKMGLQDMEARGRIGGEPVPEGGPTNEDDLTPEELAAIQEMMGMSQGGSVAGFATGGSQTEQDILTAGQEAQQNQFRGFPLGATLFPRAGSGEIESVPTTTTPAPTITIQETAESCARRGMSYDPATQTCVAMPVQAPVQTGGSSNDGPPPPPPESKPWYEGVDWTTTEIADPTAIESIVSMIPGVGLAVSMRNIAGQYAKANILEAAGKGKAAQQIRDNIDEYVGKQNLGSKILRDAFGRYADGDWMTIEYLNSIGIETPEGLKTEDGGGMEEFIAGLANDPTKRNLIAGSISPERKELIDQSVAREEAKKVAAEKAAQEAAAAAQQQAAENARRAARSLANRGSNADNSAQLAAIQKAQKIAQKAADAGTSIAAQTQTGSGGYGSASSADKPTGGQGSVSQGSGWGGMNEGGLMSSKPKNKTKRQYKKGGLAGKK